MKAKNYYKDFCVRDICHSVKSNDKKAVKEIADWYIITKEIGDDCILVPIPQHTGKAEYTLAICELIAKECGCTIADVLKCVPHKSLYMQKKNCSKGLFTGLYKVSDVERNKKIYLIDNVVSTGTTMNECMRLLPNSIPFAYAQCKGV